MLSRKQAAQHLGVSLAMLNKLRLQGIITPYRLGKHLTYYKTEDLDKAFKKEEPIKGVASDGKHS